MKGQDIILAPPEPDLDIPQGWSKWTKVLDTRDAIVVGQYFAVKAKVPSCPSLFEVFFAMSCPILQFFIISCQPLQARLLASLRDSHTQRFCVAFQVYRWECTSPEQNDNQVIHYEGKAVGLFRAERGVFYDAKILYDLCHLSMSSSMSVQVFHARQQQKWDAYHREMIEENHPDAPAASILSPHASGRCAFPTRAQLTRAWHLFNDCQVRSPP